MANNFIRTDNDEYINIDHIIGVQRNRNIMNAFDVFMDDESVVVCAYVSLEEAQDKLRVLLQEVETKNRWVVFDEYGLAVKANTVKYIKNDSCGIKFATEDRQWTMSYLSEEISRKYKEMLLGKRCETNLEKFGEYELK